MTCLFLHKRQLWHGGTATTNAPQGIFVLGLQRPRQQATALQQCFTCLHCRGYASPIVTWQPGFHHTARTLISLQITPLWCSACQDTRSGYPTTIHHPHCGCNNRLSTHKVSPSLSHKVYPYPSAAAALCPKMPLESAPCVQPLLFNLPSRSPQNSQPPFLHPSPSHPSLSPPPSHLVRCQLGNHHRRCLLVEPLCHLSHPLRPPPSPRADLPPPPLHGLVLLRLPSLKGGAGGEGEGRRVQVHPAAGNSGDSQSLAAVRVEVAGEELRGRKRRRGWEGGGGGRGSRSNDREEWGGEMWAAKERGKQGGARGEKGGS